MRTLLPIAALVYDRRRERRGEHAERAAMVGGPGTRRGRVQPHRSRPLTLALRGTGRRARVLRALLVGLLVSVAVTALSRTGVLAGWETRVVDAFLFLRDREAAPEIALVLIDDDAFQALGQRQPLSRRYVADLADFLLQSGARMVAFDLVLTAPTVAAEDQALLATIRRWSAARPGSLVFATFAVPAGVDGADGYTLLPPFAPELGGLLGFANAPIGADGMVRRFTPVLPRAGGGWLPAFSLTTLAASAGLPPAELARRLAGDGAPIPLPVREPSGALTGPAETPVSQLAARPWRVDFTGPAGAFTTFPSEPLVRL
ncbi:MAG TPA: CHASE2 domain-containing protein, partial [Methylomirabilota bacterium]